MAAPGAYVVNLDTNIIVYEKNSEQVLPTASTAKVMTAILLLEQYQDQLDSITVSMPRYIQDELYGKGMQVADIRPGCAFSAPALRPCPLPCAPACAVAWPGGGVGIRAPRPCGTPVAGGVMPSGVNIFNLTCAKMCQTA